MCKDDPWLCESSERTFAFALVFAFVFVFAFAFVFDSSKISIDIFSLFFALFNTISSKRDLSSQLRLFQFRKDTILEKRNIRLFVPSSFVECVVLVVES